MELKQTGHMLGSTCDLITHAKRDTGNRASAFATGRGLLHRRKTTWTLVHNGLKGYRSFYPPSVNSAFYSIFTSLPGFASGGQLTEFNQTLRQIGKLA